MKAILEMGQEGILRLCPQDIHRPLTNGEWVHIARTFGAFWSYDYQAAEEGRPGLHAELKSGRHSDGFFSSKVLLAHGSILGLVVEQLYRLLDGEEVYAPAWRYVAGVPESATVLGEALAKRMGAHLLKLRKEDGRIIFEGRFPVANSLLLVEDVCTRGTGFIEAVRAVLARASSVAQFVLLDPVILNRGGLTHVSVPEVGEFKIVALMDERMNDWEPTECPLCRNGSTAIKPKALPENWGRLTHSQRVPEGA